MKKDIFCQGSGTPETVYMEPFEVILIGICGGSGSGKTTLARIFMEKLGKADCGLLGQDSYYIDQSEIFDGDGGQVNFDHPSSLDFSLMARHLQDLKEGKAIEIPVYDFATHKRMNQTDPLIPKKVVLVDGTLILSQPPIRNLLSAAIFLDIPEDVRFQRRLARDVKERGRQPDGVSKQFYSQVKPMHDQFVGPSRVWAQWVVTDNTKNESTVEEMIVALVKEKAGTTSI